MNNQSKTLGEYGGNEKRRKPTWEICFAFQCQQTAHNTGCEGSAGVCGKKADTANYQDDLVSALIGLARAVRKKGATEKQMN